MAYTHIQTATQTEVTGGANTLTITLPVAPTAGNLVVVGMEGGGSLAGLAVKDLNNNVYTLTPKSPWTGSLGFNAIAYLLSAPANAAAGITATWTTGSGNTFANADEFSGPGLWQFDNDTNANGTSSGTTISTPTISPTQFDLLYAMGQFSPSHPTAPTNGSTVGVWVGSHSGIFVLAEYCLGASTPTGVNYTTASGNGWSIIAACFYTPAPPVPPTIVACFDDDVHWIGGDDSW